MRLPLVALWTVLLPLAAGGAERDEQRWVCVPTEEREWRCGRGDQAPDPAPLPPASPPEEPPPGYPGAGASADVPYYLLDPTLPAPATDEAEPPGADTAATGGAPANAGEEPAGAADTGVTTGAEEDTASTTGAARTAAGGERTPATGPARYAIQLAAARNPDSLAAYRRQLAQEGLDVHQRTWEDAGGTWHVLLAGRFATVDAANAALAELPARIRDKGAWVRPLSTLQPAAD